MVLGFTPELGSIFIFILWVLARLIRAEILG